MLQTMGSTSLATGLTPIMICDNTTIRDQILYEHLCMESQQYCVPSLVFRDWVPFLLYNLMAQLDQLKCKLPDPIVKFQHDPEQHHPGTGDQTMDDMRDFIDWSFNKEQVNTYTFCSESTNESLSHCPVDIIEASEEYPPVPMLYEQCMGSEGDVNIHSLDSSMSATLQKHLSNRSKSSTLSRQTPNHPPVRSLHEQHLGSEGDVDNASAPGNGEDPDSILLAYESKQSKKVASFFSDSHQVPFSSTTGHGIQKTGQVIQKARQETKFAPRPSLHDLWIGSEGDVNLKDDIELDGNKYRLVTP